MDTNNYQLLLDLIEIYNKILDNLIKSDDCDLKQMYQYLNQITSLSQRFHNILLSKDDFDIY